jgi:Uma2 family endonuclease
MEMRLASREHGRTIRRINLFLSKYVTERRLGEVYSEPVCELSQGAPELAVEVVSPSTLLKTPPVK